MHSVRLFPRAKGATGCEASGIAARCDWVVMTDQAPPHVELRKLVETDAPAHIFLSMRRPAEAFGLFVDELLPRLTRPFVLVSGSEDFTVPRQIDVRYPGFEPDLTERIRRLLDHPLLRMWFAENLDTDDEPKMAPLPTGLVFPKFRPPPALPALPISRVSDRPLRLLCAHRVRQGEQWRPRLQATAAARGAWSAFCTVPDGEVSEPEFAAIMQDHAFVACVEGGGLDPSPKAWQALMCGAIPVLRHGPLDRAYGQLPVVFIDDWSPAQITQDRLEVWRRELAPFYDDAAGRAEVLRRLRLDYWWEQVAEGRLHDAMIGKDGAA